jgi:hypothetical protein
MRPSLRSTRGCGARSEVQAWPSTASSLDRAPMSRSQPPRYLCTRRKPLAAEDFPETPSPPRAPPCTPPSGATCPDEPAERGDEGPHLGEGDGAVDAPPGSRAGGGGSYYGCCVVAVRRRRRLTIGAPRSSKRAILIDASWLWRRFFEKGSRRSIPATYNRRRLALPLKDLYRPGARALPNCLILNVLFWAWDANDAAWGATCAWRLNIPVFLELPSSPIESPNRCARELRVSSLGCG